MSKITKADIIRARFALIRDEINNDGQHKDTCIELLKDDIRFFLKRGKILYPPTAAIRGA